MASCASSMLSVRPSAAAVASATSSSRRPAAAAAAGRPAVLGQKSSYFLGAATIARLSPVSRQEKVSRGAVTVRAEEEPAAKKKKAKPALSVGDIVRVVKDKFEGSLESQASHASVYTGIDYIYEDRGEVLEVRAFSSGEYALVAWAGIPTTPAWLRLDQLQKVEKLAYIRM